MRHFSLNISRSSVLSSSIWFYCYLLLRVLCCLEFYCFYHIFLVDYQTLCNNCCLLKCNWSHVNIIEILEKTLQQIIEYTNMNILKQLTWSDCVRIAIHILFYVSCNQRFHKKSMPQKTQKTASYKWFKFHIFAILIDKNMLYFILE